MKIAERAVQGIFLKRLNRFSAKVLVGRRALPCFLPNPGRLKELLTPGARVLLKAVEHKGRKTKYDLVMVKRRGLVVSIDARLPNELFLDAISKGLIPEFKACTQVIREYPYKGSRLDFHLTNGLGRRYLVEVKSCTLVVGGRALFPDAPTERGRRHLARLADALKEGFEPHIFFIVQRPDARAFSPNVKVDPTFADMLKRVYQQGVRVQAWRCSIRNLDISLDSPIKVDLGWGRAEGNP